MSINNQVPFNSLTANGSTVLFPFGFLALDAGDIQVYVDGALKTLNTDYTIIGLGNQSGGNIQFVTAPANGAAIIIQRNISFSRATDYQQNGDFLAATLNRDFDRLWMAVQQLLRADVRSIKLPFDTATDQVIAQSSAQRANTFVGFDSSGNLTLSAIMNLQGTVVSAFIATLLDDADAATARTTLGANNGANLSDNTLPLSKLVRSGTTGQVLTSQGTGAAPIWANATASGMAASGITTLSGTTTLASTVGGGTVVLNSTSNLTVTLPAAGAVTGGKRIELFNLSTGIGTIQIAGTDVIKTGFGNVTAIALGQDQRLVLESDGVNAYYAVARPRDYFEFENSWYQNTLIQIPHGFGVKPRHVQVTLKNTIAELGYNPGDEATWAVPDNNIMGPGSWSWDATNIYIATGELTARVQRRVAASNADWVNVTAANWNYLIRAWKV